MFQMNEIFKHVIWKLDVGYWEPKDVVTIKHFGWHTAQRFILSGHSEGRKVGGLGLGTEVDGKVVILLGTTVYHLQEGKTW